MKYKYSWCNTQCSNFSNQSISSVIGIYSETHTHMDGIDSLQILRVATKTLNK
jgi:hypothetical protein